MPDQRPSDVLGALPRTRPQRRSTKRPSREESAPGSAAQASKPAPAKRSKAAAVKATKATAARVPKAAAAKAPKVTSAGAPKATPPRTKRKAETLRQPPQPRGIPSQPRAPVPPHRPEILGTAVQAAAELAEIGLAVSARALRRAVSRIPRP